MSNPIAIPEDMSSSQSMDDLTRALSDFKRGSSPSPPLLTCCCRRSDCECTQAWLECKAKLESRLILCAEVGQALLERHEAYLRYQQNGTARNYDSVSESSVLSHHEDQNARVADLLKENATLNKRLNQALLQSEVAEANRRVTTSDLEECRTALARLSARDARFTNFDSQLDAAMRDIDDLMQERDSESHRARLAETRASALAEKCDKFSAEAEHLRSELEQQKLLRVEFSDEVLRDARARLEMFEQSRLGHTVSSVGSELTPVLESLVADNEALKRDKAELQNLLTEAREDIKSMKDELDESRASRSSRFDESTAVGTPPSLKPHYFSQSRPRPIDTRYGRQSPMYSPSSLPRSSSPFTQFGPPASRRGVGHSRRSSSADRTKRPNEDAFGHWRYPRDDVPSRALSPIDNVESFGQSSLLRPHSRNGSATPSSHVSFELDESAIRGETFNAPAPAPAQARPARKPLMLLAKERGIQTDPWLSNGEMMPPGSTAPRPRTISSTTSPQDTRSESSSLLLDSSGTTVAALVERATVLLSRILQADPLTLSNRLKRQHLTGDVGHLSKTTVSGVLADVRDLRIIFRTVLDDDRVTLSCGRKELRGLLKFLREIFDELGNLRITLNEVILDPASAPRLRDAVMNPEKTMVQRAGSSGWIPSIKNFFGTSSPDSGATERHRPPTAEGSPNLDRTITNRRPTKMVPKLEALTTASATTVNVEFSGSGVPRATTSSGSPSNLRPHAPQPRPAASNRNLQAIFAGTSQPRDRNSSGSGWVVLPRSASRAGVPAPSLHPVRESSSGSTATLGRGMRAAVSKRLSRNVDAVLDASTTSAVQGPVDGEDDFRTTLLQRTLRRRGLSDSSIATTFLKDGETAPQESVPGMPAGVSRPHNLNSGRARRPTAPATAIPVRRNFTPNFGSLLSSWATLAGGELDLDGDLALPAQGPVGSPRNVSTLEQRPWTGKHR